MRVRAAVIRINAAGCPEAVFLDVLFPRRFAGAFPVECRKPKTSRQCDRQAQNAPSTICTPQDLDLPRRAH